MTEIQKYTPVQADAWQSLKQFTAARIALGRTGVAIPLKEVLQFRLAHAHARDAIYSQLNEAVLIEGLQQFQLPVLGLQSMVKNRNEYLLHPDLGRQLSEASVMQLQNNSSPCDISFIIADGLSATAVNHHAIPLLQKLIPLLHQSGFSLAPISIVQQEELQWVMK